MPEGTEPQTQDPQTPQIVSSNLLACPFCGSENISSGEIAGEWADGTLVKQTSCLDCGAAGPEVKGEDGVRKHASDSDADEAWNRRV